MLDAALGAFPPRRERELLAHLGQCGSCREAYHHARALNSQLDRGLASLTSGQPSPQFAARLRARMAAERPAPRFRWLAWKPALAGAAVAAVFAVLVVSWPRKRVSPEPQLNQSRSRLASTSPARPQPVEKVPLTGLSGSLRTAARHTSARRANSPSQPEVIVPPGQVQALMQLAAAIRSGRIDGKQLIAAQKQMDKPIEIAPIEFRPIDIRPIDIAPQPDSSAQTAPDSAGP